MPIFSLLYLLVFIVPVLLFDLLTCSYFDLYIFLPEHQMYRIVLAFIGFIEIEFDIYHFADIFADTDKFTDKSDISKKIER